MGRTYPLCLVFVALACGSKEPVPAGAAGSGGGGGSPGGPVTGSGGGSPQPMPGGAGGAGGSGGAGGGSRDARSADQPRATDTSAGDRPRRDGAGADGAGAAAPSSTRQKARPLGTTMAAQGFHEYLPPGYGDGSKFPLLIFMHGFGENGNGTSTLDRVVRHGPPKLIRQNLWPANRPFIVLSPQQGSGCPNAASVNAFLSFALANYDVDETRVYLTGLSCGANGTWSYLGQHRGSKVAAVAVVAGDGRAAFRAAGCALGEVAVWAFHGDQDDSVPLAGATETVASLQACPSPPRKEVKLNVYPGVGHDSWTRTYDLSAGHDPYTWLLGFSRP
jgi:predicted esterase